MLKRFDERNVKHAGPLVHPTHSLHCQQDDAAANSILPLGKSVPHFNGLPAISGAAIVATKVIKASAIR
jgi:hypothetical protein